MGIEISSVDVYENVKLEEDTKEEEVEGKINAKYDVVSAPHPHLPFHPQPHPVLAEGRGVPDLLKHHQPVSAMDVPPVSQDGGGKGPDVVYP